MPSDTLARLRARIAVTDGIAPETQRLMVGDELLVEGPEDAGAARHRPGVRAVPLAAGGGPRAHGAAAGGGDSGESGVVADMHAREQVGGLPRPRSRLMLHRDDGSAKHWRWFSLSRGPEVVRPTATLRWGKNEDGSNQTMSGELRVGTAEVGRGDWRERRGGASGRRARLQGSASPPAAPFAAPDADTREKWVAAPVLSAVSSQREAVACGARAGT